MTTAPRVLVSADGSGDNPPDRRERAERGSRVLVTWHEDLRGFDGARAGLAERGLEAVAAPLTRTIPAPEDALDALAGAIHDHEGIGLVAFTSPRALTVLGDVDYAGAQARGVRIAAVGPGTRRVLQELGITPDITGRGGADDLLPRIPAPDSDRPVAVLPNSALAAPTLERGLREKGWDVHRVPVYTTTAVDAAPDGLREDWLAGHFAGAIVRSGSAATALIDLLGRAPDQTWTVALGPSTAADAERVGLRIDAVAEEPTMRGAGSALVNRLKGSA